MNVALIGSVSSSFHTLDALIRAGVEVTGVLGLDESQASRVSDYHSLRQLAKDADLPFQSFVKVHDPAVSGFLEAHRPDLLWVIGLSQLVPERLIAIARSGGVGFHPTMLPRGRGRAPVAWTIILGERAAATLFCLADEPDAGDIIIQREVPVRTDDYSEDLIARTNEVLREAISELAPAIKAGTLPRTPQDHGKATYYAKRSPPDGLILWSRPMDKIYRLVRAAGRPYPGAYTFLNGQKVTVWRAEPATAEDAIASEASAYEPGTILDVAAQRGVLVRTGDGGLRLTETEGGEEDSLRPGARLTGRG
jgi:methionyl-tRNA formyltransferase